MNPYAAAMLAAGCVPGVILLALSIAADSELDHILSMLLFVCTLGWAVAAVHLLPALFLLKIVRRYGRMTWFSAAMGGAFAGGLPLSLTLLATGGNLLAGGTAVSLFALSGLVGGLAYRWAAGPDEPAR